MEVLAREAEESRVVELSWWEVVESRGLRVRGVERVEEGVARSRVEGMSLGVVCSASLESI